MRICDRRLLDRRPIDDDRERLAAVAAVIAAVRLNGDAALREYTERFDRVRLHDFHVAAPERALELVDQEILAALRAAARRLEAFHRRQPAASWVTAELGGLMGQMVTPLDRVGCYVPGGTAPLPSTVLHTVILARVAGVREIVVATPPNPDFPDTGYVNPVILAATAIAGATEVLCLGGAQAIAAMAYGTQTIRPVDKIVGPGNIYVTLAKKEVYGVVGVDGIAGPTEIMVVADGRARADFVAADLASQMEHDPMAWAVLVTDSAALADAVEEEFTGLSARLDRAEVVAAAHLAVILADNLEQAFQVVNDFAPEHLEIVAEDPARWLPLVENAGAVFLGDYAAVTLGDYVIGPNHTLPTSGSARFSSPLGVYSFLKRTSVASVTRGDLHGLQEAARTLARMEGLTAHANAVEVRLRDD